MTEELLHPDRALELVLEVGRSAFLAAGAGAVETLPLGEALGRVLPHGLVSPIDHPPFDKSAMDGFAVSGIQSGIESPGPWQVVETVAAGRSPTAALGSGRVARVMTGAPVPRNSSYVQRVEFTEQRGADGNEVVFTGVEYGTNIILRGENLRRGDGLLGPRLLCSQDIGILASSGYATVDVTRRPRVGIVSTGDELASPGSPLGPAQIYDSNGPQLAAQASSAGAELRTYGIVHDDEMALAEVFGRALEECDVILMSGGVSMGDFDHVPRVLEALGVARIFHRVAMRPGKPTWFGRRGTVAVFGLPGNPVSTFVNFEVFVRPHLAARSGLDWKPHPLRLRLADSFSRRGSDRVEFLPAIFVEAAGETRARPLVYKGSSMLNVLAEAELLLRIEQGTETIAEGGIVDARLLRA